MSYSLDLYFKPAIRQRRMLQYFAVRGHYAIAKDKIFYENPDTGVYFFIKPRYARNLLFERTVASAEFEINYNRPSYFGIEAEQELSDFVAAFEPRLEDGQMRGMGEGPYSRAGFLSGWNFGNQFSVRAGLARDFDPNILSMPASRLHAIWEWNYHRAKHDIRRPYFVPRIMFFLIEDRLSSAVTWPQGMPVSLPKVDYVLIGRIVSGEIRFGLASWSEVVEVVQRTGGFDTARDPLTLDYYGTPAPIAQWVANIPLIDPDAIKNLAAYKILDDELIAAARADIEREQGGL